MVGGRGLYGKGYRWLHICSGGGNVVGGVRGQCSRGNKGKVVGVIWSPSVQGPAVGDHLRLCYAASSPGR